MMRVHSFHMYTMMCSVCYTTVQISTRRPGRRFELRSVWMQLFDARMERWTTMLQIDALYRHFLVVSAYRSRLSSIAKAFVRRRFSSWDAQSDPRLVLHPRWVEKSKADEPTARASNAHIFIYLQTKWIWQWNWSAVQNLQFTMRTPRGAFGCPRTALLENRLF